MLPVQQPEVPEVTVFSLYILTWPALNIRGHREELALESTQTVQLFD